MNTTCIYWAYDHSMFKLHCLLVKVEYVWRLKYLKWFTKIYNVPQSMCTLSRSSLLSHQDNHLPHLCTQWCLWTPPSWSWYHAGCWKALETGNQTGKEEGGDIGEVPLTVMFTSPKEALVMQKLSLAACERKIHCITCTIYVCHTRHYEHFTWVEDASDMLVVLIEVPTIIVMGQVQLSVAT